MPKLPDNNSAGYPQEGFCLFHNILNTQEIIETRNELDAMLANLPERQIVYKDGKNKEVDARPEYLTEPHPKHTFWLELCRHPRILDAVEEVLGPDLILIMSHLIVKRADDGLAVAWHQDNTYWHSVQGTDVTTVWLAIDDTDRANGCMQVIPCSHEGYPELDKVSTGGDDLLGLSVEVTPEMESAAVCLEMNAGSLSVHDSFVLHGSEANTSGRRRAAYTMRYANTKTVQVDTTGHWVPIYVVRGEFCNPNYIDIRPSQQLPMP
ncbi:phytanoyl-CoA dioxygenase family protein [Verrucomicrobia bacterium]|nr:phytanoyl-CoA dioxygenase family protein [Verrucomicrobiota bacterium]